MAKPRPTEIRLVANLLDPDNYGSEGATDLAKEIIEALDIARNKRESFVYVGKIESWYLAAGDFSTRLQAEKFADKISKSGGGIITRLEDPGLFLQRIGEK